MQKKGDSKWKVYPVTPSESEWLWNIRRSMTRHCPYSPFAGLPCSFFDRSYIIYIIISSLVDSKGVQEQGLHPLPPPGGPGLTKHYPRMLCAKFVWHWSVASKEENFNENYRCLSIVVCCNHYWKVLTIRACTRKFDNTTNNYNSGCYFNSGCNQYLILTTIEKFKVISIVVVISI